MNYNGNMEATEKLPYRMIKDQLFAVLFYFIQITSGTNKKLP